MGLRRDLSTSACRIFLDVRPRVSKKPRSLQRALARYTTDPGFLRAYGQRVIGRILERTQDGIDRKSNKFRGYSESYKNSRVFALYNKSDRVNLKLTGRMQGNFKVVGTEGSQVVIAITDSEEAAKAHGHIRGSRILPKRDWFGLPADELDSLFDSVVREFNVREQAQEEAGSEFFAAVGQALLSSARREVLSDREVQQRASDSPSRLAEDLALAELEQIRTAGDGN